MRPKLFFLCICLTAYGILFSQPTPVKMKASKQVENTKQKAVSTVNISQPGPAVITTNPKRMLDVVVDGQLDAAEWRFAGQYNFDIGTCYYRLFRDTLFMAFDIAVDTYDDIDKDYLEIALDVNGSGFLDGQQVIDLQNLTYHSNIIKLKMPGSEVVLTPITGAVVAGYYGPSAFITNYSHRSWEVAIPAQQLKGLSNPGFAFYVGSGIPQFRKVVGGETGKQYSLSLQLTGDAVAITNREVPKQVTSGGNEVVSIKLLDGDKVETTYADGTRKIDNNGGYVIIYPDGKTSLVEMIQTPFLVPPTLPDNKDINQFLLNTNERLSNVIAGLLRNDPQSLTLLNNGDALLNIYQLINRRLKFLNSIHP